MAAWSWLSESIRKFAEVTMRSPAFSPFRTMKSSPARGPSWTRAAPDNPSPRSTNTICRVPDCKTPLAGMTS